MGVQCFVVSIGGSTDDLFNDSCHVLSPDRRLLNRT